MDKARGGRQMMAAAGSDDVIAGAVARFAGLSALWTQESQGPPPSLEGEPWSCSAWWGPPQRSGGYIRRDRSNASGYSRPPEI